MYELDYYEAEENPSTAVMVGVGVLGLLVAGAAVWYFTQGDEEEAWADTPVSQDGGPAVISDESGGGKKGKKGKGKKRTGPEAEAVRALVKQGMRAAGIPDQPVKIRKVKKVDKAKRHPFGKGGGWGYVKVKIKKGGGGIEPGGFIGFQIDSSLRQIGMVYP